MKANAIKRFTKQFLLLLILFFFSSVSVANKKIKVENVSAEVEVKGDVSPNMALKKCINDAKVEALRKAGVSESVKAQELLFTSEVNKDFKQFFSSNAQVEINGAVTNYEILEQGMYINSLGSVMYKVTINAEIMKYSTSSDYQFGVEVSGIAGSYVSGSELAFSLVVTQDAYLTVFNITDQGSTILFPNTIEKSFKLNKLQKYSFPKELVYSLSNDSLTVETNRLIFVVTKKEVDYLKTQKDGTTTSFEDIHSFIFNIPPDERVVEYKSFFITR
mgnify:CR=1 FL=1